MKQQERAALVPREKKTASSEKALAERLQIQSQQILREPRSASANRRTKRLQKQAKAPPLPGFRPSCK